MIEAKLTAVADIKGAREVFAALALALLARSH